MAIDKLPRQPTTFIGREAEIADLTNLLDNPTCRLLTVYGLGGVGKTRLALEVAHKQADRFPNGVHFVPLQPLASPDDILPAIFDALPCQVSSDQLTIEQLLKYLRNRQMLLILDNFEHLLDGADVLTDIIADAPGIKLLVTSREMLHLSWEWARRITGLPYPDHQSITEDSAVQLFAECARRIQPEFSLEDHYDAVVRICELVEGLPLALELAAGWLTALSCADIATEIERGLAVLHSRMRDVPQRHQNMHAVFDHSWGLLTEAERAVLRQLAVFRGGFRREAAEQVTGTDLAMLAGLVEKCWLKHTASGRYGLHELVRQYAEEQLQRTGDLAATRDAHSHYYATWLQSFEADLRAHRQLAALQAIDADFDNIQVAWTYAVKCEDFDRLNQFFSSLFYLRNNFHDYPRAVRLVVIAKHHLMSSPGPKPPGIWSRILAFAARWDTHSIEEGERALELAISSNDQADRVFASYLLANTLGDYNQFERARQVFQSILPYARQYDPYLAVSILYLMGQHCARQGRLTQARQLAHRSLVLAETTGDKVGEGWALAIIGLAASFDGNLAEISRLGPRVEATHLEIGNSGGYILNKGAQALLDFVQGRLEQARMNSEIVMEYASDHGDRFMVGGSIVQSLLAIRKQDYLRAYQLIERVYTDDVYFRLAFDSGTCCLAIASFGLRDYVAFRQHLSSLLEAALKTHSRAYMLWSLGPLILYAYHEQQYEWLAQLIGLASIHPDSPADWLAHWPLLAEYRQTLESKLGEHAYETALKSGQNLELEMITRTGLMMLTGTPQPLAEPLSKRELEVLRLLVDGLSNEAIAEHLVVSIGTVKTHTHNIYGKLGVDNRVQAVTQAQSLGLI